MIMAIVAIMTVINLIVAIIFVCVSTKKTNDISEEINYRLNTIKGDIEATDRNVSQLRLWRIDVDAEREQRRKEEKKKQEKENANYLIKFIEPEFQKIIDNSKNSNKAIAPMNYIIDKIKPIITETAYIELKGKSMKMLAEAHIKEFKGLFSGDNKDSD